MPATGVERGPAALVGEVMLAVYYLAVLAALAVLYAVHDVSTAGFVYQAF